MDKIPNLIVIMSLSKQTLQILVASHQSHQLFNQERVKQSPLMQNCQFTDFHDKNKSLLV